MTKNQTRIHWIDLARFIGIFAIIFGHTIQGGALNKYVYSFHVSLFFFLQGAAAYISYKPVPFKQFSAKKAYSLLVPYAVFGLVSTLAIIIAMQIFPDTISQKLGFDSPLVLVIEFLLGRCPANRPLWFLPATFLLSLMCYRTLHRIKTVRRTDVKLTCAFILVGVAMLFFVLNEKLLHAADLFFKAESAVYGIVFFVTACLLYDLGIFEKLENLSLKQRLPLAIALVALGATLGILNGKAEYSANYFGNVFVFYISAFSSILGIILVCMSLPQIEPLEYIGRHTLVLLVLHKFPVLAFQYFVPFVKDKLSENSTFFGILVTFAVIGICLAAELVIDKICPLALGKRKEKTKRI